MATTVHIWASDEVPPSSLFNRGTCPAAPPHWFREEPAYAAELYGLERGPGQYVIYIIDAEGASHRFDVKVQQTIEALVTPR